MKRKEEKGKWDSGREQCKAQKRGKENARYKNTTNATKLKCEIRMKIEISLNSFQPNAEMFECVFFFFGKNVDV